MILPKTKADMSETEELQQQDVEQVYKFCPICGQRSAYYESPLPEPFTHYEALEGLLIWGAFSAPKEIVCKDDGNYIHFKILVDGVNDSNRLVKLNVQPEPLPQIVPQPQKEYDPTDPYADLPF